MTFYIAAIQFMAPPIPPGFYTLPGALTIAGIHGLPVALYLAQKQSDWVPYTVGWGDPLVWPTVFILAAGRTIGAAVEVGARPSLAAVQDLVWLPFKTALSNE